MPNESRKISSQVSEVNPETTLTFDVPISVSVIMPNEAEYTVLNVVKMTPFSMFGGCVGFKIDQEDGAVTVVPPGYSLMVFIPRESK
jgi:hypothetical protein